LLSFGEATRAACKDELVSEARLTFFVHLTATPAWLALSRSEHQRVIATHVEPLLKQYAQVTIRWVECGDHVLDQWGYMAGRDEDRLADLNDALRDSGIRAVIATRGGAGAYRIADQFDFDAVCTDPKPLVGFSDITNLHLALWRHTGLVRVHGCLAGHRAAQAVRTLLTETTPSTLYRDAQSITAAIVTPGQASGPLVGGNLSAVVRVVQGVRFSA
jgi:muramoyltetrapeptide carboxypeptidase